MPPGVNVKISMGYLLGRGRHRSWRRISEHSGPIAGGYEQTVGIAASRHCAKACLYYIHAIGRS